MLWFTSDLHLCHENILTFTQRPFATVDEMARAIIANINECVGESDTLCILEAMKMMSEVPSPMDGVIAEVLVSDGELVGFDQPLFRFK